jgi:hypothetical protein
MHVNVNFKIKVSHLIIGVVLLGSLLWGGIALAGDPDSSSNPASTTSYSLEDLYQRLDVGTTGTQSAFTEPSTAPGAGTMHTLNEIYDLIGQRAPVPKTGQSKCYDAGGTEIACAGTGQDGEYQKGVTWPTPRFITSTTGIVTDTLTGLIWLQNANCAGITMNWTRALTEVVELNTAGTMNSNDCGDTSNSGSHQTDWRLPNVRELQSLIHYGYYNRAVPNTAGTGQWTAGDPFTGVQSGTYWSGSTYALNTSIAWLVDMDYGSVGATGKTNSSYVWPVRGGQ